MSIPTPEEGHWEFQGRGGSKPNVFKGTYELNWTFQSKVKFQTNKFSVGGVWIFSGITIVFNLYQPMM